MGRCGVQTLIMVTHHDHDGVNVPNITTQLQWEDEERYKYTHRPLLLTRRGSTLFTEDVYGFRGSGVCL
jgi:hypothetical protein